MKHKEPLLILLIKMCMLGGIVVLFLTAAEKGFNWLIVNAK